MLGPPLPYLHHQTGTTNWAKCSSSLSCFYLYLGIQHNGIKRSSSDTIYGLAIASPTSLLQKMRGTKCPVAWQWGCRHPCRLSLAPWLVLTNRSWCAHCVGTSWLRALGKHLLPAASTRDCSTRGWHSGRTALPCCRWHLCSGRRKGHCPFWPGSCTVHSFWVVGSRGVKKSEVRAVGSFARHWLGFPAIAPRFWWQGMTECSTS